MNKERFPDPAQNEGEIEGGIPIGIETPEEAEEEAQRALELSDTLEEKLRDDNLSAQEVALIKMQLKFKSDELGKYRTWVLNQGGAVDVAEKLLKAKERIDSLRREQ